MTLPGATELSEGLLDARLAAIDVTDDCLARIETREPDIRAWAWLDPGSAREQANQRDDDMAAGKPVGPLHGLPVGVKDIVDTRDMPTELGTPVFAGRRPRFDATVVRLLRETGAVILGKTVSTELACFRPNVTRNPRDPARTPGGSSSGSAAAVAADMVPFAIGTQTNGSIIRPAAYCGVFGYKPTLGLISRTGMLVQSYLLDHVGVFARSLEDLALVAEPLMVFDQHDPGMHQAAPPALRAALSDRAATPRLGFVRTHAWDLAEPSTQAAFEALAERVGATIIELPADYAEADALHRIIWSTDIATTFKEAMERGRDRLAPFVVEAFDEGRRMKGMPYKQARARRGALAGDLDTLLGAFDGVITPASFGEAPVGLDNTGSPAFCTLWSLMGAPAVSLPLLTGPAGMPLGVQLVGARGGDERLFRAARWLVAAVSA